ncbi:diacylglycerol kinase [Gilvimarinus polysaccharolyticus]|uniref:diacylglycerol kinase n=1 Tax=Gilvimarinus polysaccharolyticus TaxID=863921 RepID=UPI000673857B|nr:diacylglycerol kinase [Gilvimarinus polysaccharolyticus]
MSKPGKSGWSRLKHATVYSMQGLAAAWRYEAAFRLEVILTLLGLPLAWWLARTHVELILLVASLFWVLVAELVNSAVEAVVDRTGSEHHELSGRAKDIASAVVMVSLSLCVFVWLVIAWHRFM